MYRRSAGWLFVWDSEKNTAADWRELVEAIVYGTSRAIPAFIVLSLTVVLLAEFIGGVRMVLAEYLKHRFEKRGIATGREQANAAWEAWYERMKEAQHRGESFDEPPPSEKR